MSEAAGGATGAGRTILLVDDDTSLLITLGDFLRFEGYRVVTAEDAETGLARLAQIEPDVIILDMSMPGMGGLGFLRAIADRGGKLRYPVLVLTARRAPGDAPELAAADGYVFKPCEPQELLNEIQRVLLTRGRPSGNGGGERAPARPAAGRRVLVGEDDPARRERLVAALRQAGFAAEGAANGPALLEQAVLERPDAILLKLAFGTMQGDAVAAMARNMASTRGVPVVLYDDSGAQVPEGRYADPALGIRRFVRGADPAALAAALREALGGADAER